MRVDRPDLAHESDDVGMPGNPRPSDEPDDTDKDLKKGATSEDLPGPSPVLPDAALRIERTMAYRTRVEAVYRQYGIDHGHGAAKEPDRETVTLAMPRVEAEARHCPRVGLGSRPTEEAWLGEVSDGSASLARQPSGGLEGKLLHADADPLRVFGPASETHPEEFQEAMTRLSEAGVEVDLRPGTMSYSPAAMGGRPGRLILDPEASYGAVLHEMSHFSDDELAGFPGLRYWLEDPAVTADGESRAYQTEIDYANSIGEPGIVDQLEELKAQRIGQLIGENDE